MIMKFLTNLILAIGMIIGSLWGAFIAVDGFIVSKAKSAAQEEVRPIKAEVDTHYIHINQRLKNIDDKLDRMMIIK